MCLFTQLDPFQIREISTIDSFVEIEDLARTILPEAYKKILPAQYIENIITGGHSVQALLKKRIEKDGRNFVIQDEEINIGYVSLSFKDEICTLEHLYLLPEYRGLQIGDRVLSSVFDHARKTDLTQIRLKVHKENSRAVRFYQRHGFSISRTIERNLNDDFTLCGYEMKYSLS